MAVTIHSRRCFTKVPSRWRNSIRREPSCGLSQLPSRVRKGSYCPETPCSTRPDTEIPPLLRALLTMRVNATATHKKRETALHLAAKNGGGFLLEIPSRGPARDWKAVAEGYLTGLQYAAQKGSPETARVLVCLGADTEAISNDGQTALQYAVQHATPETLLDLIELGAKPDTKQETNSDGKDGIACGDAGWTGRGGVVLAGPRSKHRSGSR